VAWDNLISRGLWLFLQPSNLIFVLLLIGILLVWRGRRKAGLSVLLCCLAIYGLTLFGPLTNWLLIPLEKRFSVYTNDLSQAPYSGIIVLAGSERLRYSATHDQVTLNGGAERLIEAAKLARIFPSLPLIYCGGGRIDGLISETEIARKFFREAGIDPARIRFDDRSYNTYSNALEAKKLITEGETGKWLLVTSAFHMPRSVGAFRKARIYIQPYPVDYRSSLRHTLFGRPDAGRNFYELDFALHEWVGMLAYYLRGRSDHLFPAP